MTVQASTRTNRRAVLVVGAVVLLMVTAGAGYLFQPWRAFIDRTVSEAAPVATGSAAASVPAAGRFTSIAHDTTGSVSVRQAPDGSQVLRIENLDTTDGPDVRVWLSDRDVTAAGTAGDGTWLELGPLRGNKGSLTYPLPAGTDLSKYRSVVLWCKRFGVAFGAAPLRA